MDSKTCFLPDGILVLFRGCIYSSFHPHKAVKVVESVMQPNDEVRGEYLHGRDCRGKGLKLVLWICTYLYTCIYIYIYHALKNTGQTDHYIFKYI